MASPHVLGRERTPVRRVPVYNFGVAGTRTYFVGELGLAAPVPVWVHNNNSDRVPVPDDAQNAPKHMKNRTTVPGTAKGGATFENREGRLPTVDGSGKEITYQEWDTEAPQPNSLRGLRRIVTGSDGEAYYTDDHYDTFTEISG